MEGILSTVFNFILLAGLARCAPRNLSLEMSEIATLADDSAKQLVDTIQNIGTVMKHQYDIIDIAKNSSNGVKEGSLQNYSTTTPSAILTQESTGPVAECSPLLQLEPADPSLYPGCRQEDVESCFKALVDMDLLKTANQMYLPGGVCMGLTSRCQDNAVFQSPQGEEAVLRWSNKTLIGSINTNNGSFLLEGCKGCAAQTEEGCFLLLKYNMTNFQEVEPEEDEESEQTENCRTKRQTEKHEKQNWKAYHKQMLDKGEADNKTVVTYTLMIWTTTQFDESFVDSQEKDAFIANLFTLTNLGYSNSRMPIRVKLHAVMTHPTMNDDTADVGVKPFKRTMPGRQLRNCADAAVLLMEKFKKCGVALLEPTHCGTFAVVKKSCATGYYTFGHEVGHIFGAKHNREVYHKKKQNNIWDQIWIPYSARGRQ